MLKIFDWLRNHPPIRETATELYGSIVAQARLPLFYTGYGIADVAEKRYEMIVLHMVLIHERLRSLGDPDAELAQHLNQAFVSDLDGSVREMAVGDNKVPNSVRKAAAGLLDRDQLYRDAFTAPPPRPDQATQPAADEAGTQQQASGEPLSLQGLLQELLFDGAGRNDPAAIALRDYVEAARAALDQWSPGESGTQPPFPAPQAFLEAAQ